MIVSIVRFKLPPDVDLERAEALFRQSAPRYREIDGLVRKYYLFAPGQGGGCYLWTSRAAAEAVFDAGWRQMIVDRYGAPPTVDYYESPVIVDNAAETLRDDIAVAG